MPGPGHLKSCGLFFAPVGLGMFLQDCFEKKEKDNISIPPFY